MIAPEIIDRLRYVRVTDPSAVDMSRFPDFLIIGPQRTGTTWLHANLREHPEVFLSEPKELFYFSRLCDEHLHEERSIPPDLSWYLDFFKESPLRYLRKQALSLYFSRRLYAPRVRGEATASYAAMDREVIDELAVLAPGTKAIMMVRDPIERAWSHAKKDLVRNVGKKIEDVTDSEVEEFVSRPYQVRCARYAENLANWRSALGDDNVFVGRFEEVSARPVKLMCEVMSFLGVSADPRFAGRSVNTAVNPAGGSAIPPRYREMLERILSEELEAWRRGIA